MPVEIGEEKSVSESAELVDGAEYTVTFTPSADLYAFGDGVSSQKGEPYTAHAVVAKNMIDTGGGAAETEDVEDPNTTAYIGIGLGFK